MSKNKRKHKRFEAQMPAQLKFINIIDPESKGVVSNISEGGFCLEGTEMNPDVGDRIAFLLGFRFSNPAQPIIGIGEVRWKRVADDANLNTIGIEFKSIDVVSADKVNEYIRTKQSEKNNEKI